MQNFIVSSLWAVLALIAGGAIGYGFGMIQNAALRRHERLQQAGKLTNGWAVMPGSGKRVAYLLVCLALVQFFCPMLFTDGTQWWVSGGVVLGYGYVLAKQLRAKLSSRNGL